MSIGGENTKTAEEIIGIIEADLAEAWESFTEWGEKDEAEATIHLVRAQTLELLLDKIEND